MEIPALIVCTLVLFPVNINGMSSTGNRFIFNAGTCYSSDCRCFGECCDQKAADQLFANNVSSPEPLYPLQYIGAGENYNLANCKRCDHANDSTAIFMQKIKYDGDLKWCRWYTHYDCADTGLVGGSDTTRLSAFPNLYLRIGLFEREPGTETIQGSYQFKLLKYITLNRTFWYDHILKDGEIAKGSGRFFNYTFTKKNKIDLSPADTGKINGLYIGFSWSKGGAVCYQKPLNSFLNGPEMMTIYDDPTELGPWDKITLGTNTYVGPATMGKWQRYRHYNMRCAYRPSSM